MRFLFPLMLVGAMAAPVRALDTSMLPPADPWKYLPLQRIQALLAASTDQNPHPVRILFYGQSITQQEWWRTTAAELRRLFPQARLLIENRAISSFNASFLIKTAESDVFPFRPDLIFFHCYGPGGPGQEWEQLLRRLRSRTTADVILLGNHMVRDSEMDEPTDPTLVEPMSEAWLNYVFSPALAHELGLCFPDNRTAWKAYLRAEGLPAKALLVDQVHLNPDGSALQFAVLRPYLRTPLLTPGVDPFNNGRVATWPIGPGGMEWSGGRLRLAFVGNRVDAIAAPGPLQRCRVLVDGAEPTSLPSGRGYQRSSGWAGESLYRPALLNVGFVSQPLLERWTLTVTEVDPADPNLFRYSVAGSLTGPDGSGVSTNLFVSDSGRVRIGADDWFRSFPSGYSQKGTTVIWETEERAVDVYAPRWVPGGSIEPVTTLINDLPDGPHVLELIAQFPDALPSVAALRTYHPGGPMPGTEPESAGVPALRFLLLDEGALTVWPAVGGDGRSLYRAALDAPWSRGNGPLTNLFGFAGERWAAEGTSAFFGLERP